MDTIYKHYSSLKESYYKISIDTDNLFSSNETRLNCCDFINKHFIKGNKKKVFAIPQNYMNTYLENGKHQHTVSLYLFGLLLKKKFNVLLRKNMQKLFDVKSWYEFEYTWYLTCLYHDVTSVIERIDDVRHNYRKDQVRNSQLFDFDEKILRFSKETYFNYLKYRYNNNRIEHGLIAGTELFDRLYESFVQKTAGHDWTKSKIHKKENLIWRKEHLPHFAYISDAICCHNIWLVNCMDKEKVKEYRNNGLDELIVNSDADKLNLADYPLQYLLCLLDTIEPIKRFKNLSADTVLKNIYFDIMKEKITIAWNPIIKKQPQFFDWLKSISTLSDWMNIKVSECVHKGDMCQIDIFFDIKYR